MYIIVNTIISNVIELVSDVKYIKSEICNIYIYIDNVFKVQLICRYIYK